MGWPAVRPSLGLSLLTRHVGGAAVPASGLRERSMQEGLGVCRTGPGPGDKEGDQGSKLRLELEPRAQLAG